MVGDSPEFSFNFASLGVPGNPLDGGPMAQDSQRPRKWWDKGTRKPLASPGRLESGGMTGVGSFPSATQLPQNPEQLLVPDTVSALDPAYSMTPKRAADLQGLSKIPAADTGSTSPWTQWRSKDKTKLLRRSELLSGLNMGTKGLDLPYQDQGVASLGK